MVLALITEIENPIGFQTAIMNNTQSPKLPVMQTNKQTNILSNACAQEALQTPALP